jgi:hypothetical protein
MRLETLPAPGLLSNGIRLRIEAAKAISTVEVVAGRTPGGKVSSAGTLRTFFTACASALDSLVDATAPTVSSRVRNSATQATITFSEPLSPSVVPAPAAFTIGGGATVTAVAVSGSTVVLTGTGINAGATVTYTRPATNFLRDLVGNPVATFSGVLA